MLKAMILVIVVSRFEREGSFFEGARLGYRPNSSQHRAIIRLRAEHIFRKVRASKPSGFAEGETRFGIM